MATGAIALYALMQGIGWALMTARAILLARGREQSVVELACGLPRLCIVAGRAFIGQGVVQRVRWLRVATIAILNDGSGNQPMLEAAHGQVRVPPHVLAMARNAL